MLQSAQAWSTLAPDEHAVTRTYELVHMPDSGSSALGIQRACRRLGASAASNKGTPIINRWSRRSGGGLVHEEQRIRVRSQEWRERFDRIKVATRLSSGLGEYCLDQAEEIRRSFEELIGKPGGGNFTSSLPFYTDYGLNITVGRAVFIGYLCAFTGHADITIADEVMIAHKVNLVTGRAPR